MPVIVNRNGMPLKTEKRNKERKQEIDQSSINLFKDFCMKLSYNNGRTWKIGFLTNAQ